MKAELIKKIKEVKTYEGRYNIDVSPFVDKKQNYDYISWANCELIGNLITEDFNWELKHIDIDNGLVEVGLTINKKYRTHKYPILDFRNKSIPKPNSFDINNAQMRGLAKLFSMMTGIGLKLFTGEDLKQYDKPQIENTKTDNKIELTYGGFVKQAKAAGHIKTDAEYNKLYEVYLKNLKT